MDKYEEYAENIEYLNKTDDQQEIIDHIVENNHG
jgi:hypothetical protein